MGELRHGGREWPAEAVDLQLDRQDAAGDQLAAHHMTRVDRRDLSGRACDMLAVGEFDSILREPGDGRVVARQGGNDAPDRTQTSRNAGVVGLGVTRALGFGAIGQPGLKAAREVERADADARGDTCAASERYDALDRDFERATVLDSPA